MKGLQQLLWEQDDFQTILQGIDEGLEEQLVSGLSGSSRAVFIAAAYEKKKRPIIVVTYNLLQAQKLYDDLTTFVPTSEVYLYPANEVVAADIGISSPELKADRIETLNFLHTQKPGIVIVPVSGLRKLLPPPSIWSTFQLKFNIGDEIEVEDTIQQIVHMGYQRVDMVDAPGDFSMRGGILDIYPLTEENPVRIELFDTEVDSIRSFSAEDQRSIEKMDTVFISPASELPIVTENLPVMADKLEKLLSSTLKKVKAEAAKEQLTIRIGHEIETLRANQLPEQYIKYAALAYDEPSSLLDYLSKQGVIFFDEPSRIQELNTRLDNEEAEWMTSLLEEGNFVHGLTLSHSSTTLLHQHSFIKIYMSLFLKSVPGTSPQNLINFTCKQMQNFHGQLNLLKTEIERYQKSGFTVLFQAITDERMHKLQELLSDYDVSAEIRKESSILQSTIQIVQGNLHVGFELPMQKLAVITEEEMFNKKYKKKSKRRQKMSNAERIKSYSELKTGDYVVHVNHGIGRYLGMETLTINGIHKDYLHIKYQGTDKLFVPIEQIDLVQKYVGSEGKEPKVYKLGGSDWKRVKKKVESSVQDIADDLIKLYAEREQAKGYAFAPDGDMQREFEAAFPYDETEDQLQSIHEIKNDMEKERPMDRLLCGDVGYGKTEVAIRAAFKSIMDGKQVAFLVPTTILAQQHYETMKERFQDYPISVGLMSRFRTRKQQTEIKKGLKNGTVDIVIGTHRMLSKDVIYQDLGLLIIDEEQRFGVTHKEKIKQLKTNIDVLTLTATPIPRTLHMSMLGVRDLSVIETPPENRFPVQTYVMEYNGNLVREAIERELARNGQVYFLHNRVEDIERKAEEISMLVPDARVTYAHGRMTESELESVILSFYEGEYDVLVTTTIIETGVDISNVNTLIVNDADRMGLSQLYQLRGRVGRSNRVAYAYFTYRKDKVLSEVSEKRLQAIKEFTELGSGFKIAMRDLSIRGAGNLLGAQQHGFIDSVGFDLYSQMLKEAVEARQGNQDQVKEEPFEIDLMVDAYIPDEYIADGFQKIEMYKRFRALSNTEELDELKEELVDRFGDYPEQVAYLFDISEIKLYAKEAKLVSIKQNKQRITLLMSEEGTNMIDGGKIADLAQSYGREVGFGMEDTQFIMTIVPKGMDAKKLIEVTRTITEKLRDAFKVKAHIS